MIVWGEEMENRNIKKNRRGEIYVNNLIKAGQGITLDMRGEEVPSFTAA